MSEQRLQSRAANRTGSALQQQASVLSSASTCNHLPFQCTKCRSSCVWTSLTERVKDSLHVTASPRNQYLFPESLRSLLSISAAPAVGAAVQSQHLCNTQPVCTCLPIILGLTLCYRCCHCTNTSTLMQDPVIKNGLTHRQADQADRITVREKGRGGRRGNMRE